MKHRFTYSHYKPSLISRRAQSPLAGTRLSVKSTLKFLEVAISIFILIRTGEITYEVIPAVLKRLRRTEVLEYEFAIP
jgi:hypothetical protein